MAKNNPDTLGRIRITLEPCCWDGAENYVELHMRVQVNEKTLNLTRMYHRSVFEAHFDSLWDAAGKELKRAALDQENTHD